MDFGFSEEQEMLRSSARDFLAKEAPMTYVRKMMEDEVGFTADLWKKMADLGWMGLILPEQYGGSGLDFVDLIVVLEEMGRVVLPGPFFSTVVLGGVALLEGGSDGLKQALLPKLASGDLKVTLRSSSPRDAGTRTASSWPRRPTPAASSYPAPSSSCPTRTAPTRWW